MAIIQSRERYIVRVTVIGSAVNLLLVIFKFVAGILGHSTAMIADAAHSLSDFISDVIVLVCIKISSRPEDESHEYGHGKFETLAAVAIGLILFIAGAGILWDGLAKIVKHFQGESLPAPNWLAFLAAVISIACKEGLYHYTLAAARKIDSQPLAVNAWHHRSDAFSSVATVIGVGGAMIPGGHLQMLDPLAACLISFFIMGIAISLMKPGLDELMEKSLPEKEKATIKKVIAETPGVSGFHRLRTRRIGVNRAVEVHIKLDGELSLADAHEVATQVERRLKKILGGRVHTVIHMEPR